MKIQNKRIRNVENYLREVESSGNFYIGITDINSLREKIINSGFKYNLEAGQQILPEKRGCISKFNAEGGYIRHKNLPKERVSRQAEIKDWHGYYHIVDIHYYRYPRTIISPPSIELTVKSGNNSSLIIVSPSMNNIPSNYKVIQHTINLFLELFGECEILRENLLPSISLNIRKLNWHILPKGNYPWETLRPQVQEIINKEPENQRNIIQNRFEWVANKSHDFVAIGQGGFSGYLIFGFSHKNLYVLESTKEGNATYILGDDWETISQMTKKEILDNSLHKYRFIHGQNWRNQIDNLLN